MSNFFNTLRKYFAPPVFEGDDEKTRAAELVNTVLISLMFFSLVALVGILLGGQSQPAVVMAAIVLFALMLGLQIPLRRGFIQPVSITIVAFLSLALYLTLPTTGTIRAPAVAIFIFTAIIAGLTIGRKAAYGITVLNILFVAWMVFAEVKGLLPEPDNQVSIQQAIMFDVSAIMSVILIDLALRRIQTAYDEVAKLNVGLEERVAERTKALETSAEISRRLTSILDPRDLAKTVVTQVQSVYDYYYAQVYLFDEAGENLVLTAGTGDAGVEMMKRGHSLEKGRGLVGRAADNNASILVSDTSQDPNWLPNELLPDTKAEAVVPISIGDQVYGVLDVQDDVTNDITPEDITLLESLAGQVAISLQNAESYARAEVALQEAKSLVDNAPEAIVVVDLTTGLFTDPNKNAERLYGLNHDELIKVGPAQMSPPTQPDGSDSTKVAMELIGEAMEGGTPVFEWVHRNGHGEDFQCEIHLVRLPGDTPRVRATVIDITERKQLQEFTAQRARQQEAINLITQRIQSATTIEEAMQVAARELGHALGQKQTAVALEASALGSNGK